MATISYSNTELQALASLLAPLVAPLLAPTPPVVVVPPPVVTPPAGVFWLFNAGKFVGAGDYSYGSGKVTYGATIVVTGDEGLQPRMPGDDFDTTGYNFVLVSIKPTQKQTWISGMEKIGDVPIPGNHGPVDITPYGPKTLVLNTWNDFKIPIGLFGNMPTHMYKIMFQGQNVASPSTNKVEFDKIGFSPS